MNVKVTATCIRVPVMRAHAESVNLQFENPLDEVNDDTIKRYIGYKTWCTNKCSFINTHKKNLTQDCFVYNLG